MIFLQNIYCQIKTELQLVHDKTLVKFWKRKSNSQNMCTENKNISKNEDNSEQKRVDDSSHMHIICKL